MKKIFMLLIAAGSFVIASAQSRGFDNGKKDYGYSFNSKKQTIQQINREYDFKISAVKQNRWMSRREKMKQIDQLERMRDAEISRVQFRFEKDNHGYSDHGYSDNKKGRW